MYLMYSRNQPNINKFVRYSGARYKSVSKVLALAAGCPEGCCVRHPRHLPQSIRIPAVAGETIILGRGDDVDVQLDSLRHPTMISRRHCRIGCQVVASVMEWYIEDLEAANGTHVNGAPAKRARLRLGDFICLGIPRGRNQSDARYRLAAPGMSDDPLGASTC